MMHSSVTIIAVVLLLVSAEMALCGVLGGDRDPRQQTYGGNSVDLKAKRPFCNAFTGCGRKRSNEIVPPGNIGVDEEDGISDLLELNSEPAIESLMRQIMSEAKMYEAIQEANREMFLQKMKHVNSANRSPSTYSMQ